MKGKRIDPQEGVDTLILLKPGDYGTDVRQPGNWYACTPNGLLANLGSHEIVENSDGTITVSPSILVTCGKNNPDTYHGYLENGIWRDA